MNIGYILLSRSEWQLIYPAQCFLRDPTVDEWGRFSYYAKRVQVLWDVQKTKENNGYYGAGLTNIYSACLFDLMNAHFGATPAFAHLKSLRFATFGVLNISHLSLFVQPHLQSIEITVDDFIWDLFDERETIDCVRDTENMVAAAAEIPKIAPFLQTLLLPMYTGSDDHSFPANTTAITAFARMDNLVVLDLSVEVGRVSRRKKVNNNIVLPAGSFPSLQKFSIEATCVEYKMTNPCALLESVLRSITSPSLKSLHVGYRIIPQDEYTLHPLFAAIMSHLGTLKECSIVIRPEPYRRYHPRLLSTSELLAPLLHGSPSDTRLTLMMPTLRLNIRNSDLEALVSSWKSIRHIELGCHNTDTVSAVSRLELKEFAERVGSNTMIWIPTFEGDTDSD